MAHSPRPIETGPNTRKFAMHKSTGSALDGFVCADLLEHVLDGHGLGDTLGMFSEICAAKATHIQLNWAGTDSEELARRWTSMSRKLDKLARLEVFKHL